MGFVIDERCHIVSGITENFKTLILWQSSKSYELSLLFYIDNFWNWEFSLNWAFLSSQSTNYFSKKQTMQTFPNKSRFCNRVLLKNNDPCKLPGNGTLTKLTKTQLKFNSNRND
jgi:hypothetical protein